MLTSNLKLDVITFATVAVPGTPVSTFSAITVNDIKGGAEFFTENPSGHPAPLFGAIKKIKPEITFTTPQIDVVVNALSAWGAGLSAKLYQKKSSGVAPLARSGTVHKRWDVAQAVACWSQITLPATATATADLMLRAIWNGTALPIVANGGVALPAAVLTAANYFAAGPVYLNGSLIDGVQSITIASGVKFDSEGDSSTVYDTYGQNTVEQLLVTIKTKNAVNWSTILIGGTAVADLTFFGKAWANAQAISFVDDADSAHILFNAFGIAAPGNSTACGQELYSDTFTVLCLAADDTHPPMTVTLLQPIAAP